MRKMKKAGLAVAAMALIVALSGCGLFGPKGFVEGTVVDATTGSAVEGISVGGQGVLFAGATTDASGKFSIELPVGDQTVTFTDPGYAVLPADVSVTAGTTSTIPYTVMASPKFLDDGVRLVLTWGETPADLDLHLWTPGGTTHVYWANENDGGSPFLDIDDTTGFGPETITLTDPASGNYEVYVHNYSAASRPAGATVSVYFSDNTIRTYEVPSTGTEEWWHVGTFNGTTFSPKATLEATAPYGFTY